MALRVRIGGPWSARVCGQVYSIIESNSLRKSSSSCAGMTKKEIDTLKFAVAILPSGSANHTVESIVLVTDKDTGEGHSITVETKDDDSAAALRDRASRIVSSLLTSTADREEGAVSSHWATAH